MTNGILDSGQKIITDGLVLNLDAAQLRSYPTTGTTWTDLSGNNNNGTLVNGPTFNPDNGGSIVFDGTNDYVDSVIQSIPIQDNTPFTVDIIYRIPATGTGHLIGNWNVFVTPGWRIDIVSGQIRFLILNANGGAGRAIRTNSTYGNGSIFHFCSTYSGNSNISGMTLYINGTSVQITSILNTSPGTLTNSKITLGASQVNTTSFTNYLAGNIYQAKLYNRALSATEVLQNYNATKSRYGL